MSAEIFPQVALGELPMPASQVCANPDGTICPTPSVDQEEAVFLDQVFPVFRERVAAQRHKIRASWACRDRSALYREVHTLKGTAGTFGMDQTSRLAQELLEDLRIKAADATIERHLVQLLAAISPQCVACYAARLHALAQGEEVLG